MLGIEVKTTHSVSSTDMPLSSCPDRELISSLAQEEDINAVLAYFSYEHFYVVYCKVRTTKRGAFPACIASYCTHATLHVCCSVPTKTGTCIASYFVFPPSTLIHVTYAPSHLPSPFLAPTSFLLLPLLLLSLVLGVGPGPRFPPVPRRSPQVRRPRSNGTHHRTDLFRRRSPLHVRRARSHGVRTAVGTHV